MSPEAFLLTRFLQRWIVCLSCLLLCSAAFAQATSLSIINQATATATDGDEVVDAVSNIVETVLQIDTAFGEIVKTATPPSGSDVEVGDEIAYEVSFSTAPVPLDNLTFRDELSPLLELLGDVVVSTSPDTSVADDAQISVADNVITVLWDTLPASTSVTIAFRVRVLGPGSIENTARVSSSSVEGEGVSNTTEHQGVESGIRDLLKEAIPASGELDVGTPLRYTVRFQVADVALTDVVVSDVLSPYLSAPSGFSDGTIVDPVSGETIPVEGDYDAVTRTLSWRFERLEPSTTVVLSVDTAVAVGAPGNAQIDNQACVSGQGIDGEECSNVVTHTVAAFCALNITPDGTVTDPGQSLPLEGGAALLRYKLVNTGNASYRYRVEAQVLPESTLTPDLTLFLGEGEPSDATPPYMLTTSSLAAGSEVEVFVNAASDQRGEAFIDLVGRCNNDPAIVDASNVGEVFDVIPGFVDIEKRADPETDNRVIGGQTILYTLALQNGRVPLQNVVIRDTLDDALINPQDATSGTLTDPVTGATTEVRFALEDGGRTLVWRIAELPSAFNVVIEFRAAVRRDISDATDIDNVFGVRSDATPAQNSNIVSHTAYPAELLITKEVTPRQLRVGQRARYTVTLINPSSEVPLERLELVDTIPPGTRYVPRSAEIVRDGATTAFEPEVRGGELFWDDVGGLEPGAQLSLHYELRILPAALRHNRLVNTVTALARNAGGEVVADGEAAADVEVDDPLLQANAVITGTAYIDDDASGTLSSADTPVEGLRLYLPTGVSTVTDEFGHYTFPDVMPGVSALKVDPTTLPARALQATPDQEAPGLWNVRPRAGLILHRDVPFEPGQVDLFVRRRLSLSQGPLTVSKYINPVAASLDPETGLPTRWAVTISVTSDTVVTNLYLRERVVAGMSAQTGDEALVQQAFDTSVAEGVGGAVSATEDGMGVFRLRLEPDQLLILRYELSLAERPALSVPQLVWETE
ncbi:MAG: isopeptide-forming domain-containing fimbrial protein [Trueperaceae bacterium]|nr:isopeptide-forming domain-containing fimbrial protein [Trueperaceae bacterium]